MPLHQLGLLTCCAQFCNVAHTTMCRMLSKTTEYIWSPLVEVSCDSMHTAGFQQSPETLRVQLQCLSGWQCCKWDCTSNRAAHEHTECCLAHAMIE